MKKLLLYLGALCFGLFLYSVPAAGQTYCKPSFSGGCSSGDSIKLFQIGSYLRTSGCSTGGYDSSTMTTDTVKLYVGRTYKLRIKGSRLGDRFGLWIDYNKDGDFNDPGELVAAETTPSNDSLSTIIKIPEYAQYTVTRMRALATYTTATVIANGYVNDTNSCQAFADGGEAEDYVVQITAYPDDARIIATHAPQHFSCAGSSQAIILVVQNYGTNTLTSIPVGYKLNNTVYRDTINKTILPGGIDTFTFNQTINAPNGGTFTAKAYTALPGDYDRGNDTVSRTLTLGVKPAEPDARDTVQCGYVQLYAKAESVTPGSATRWYKTANADTAFHTGDSLLLPILTSDTTLYVQNGYYQTNSLKTQYNGDRTNNILIFDLKPNTTIVVDSFQSNFSTTATVDSVAVLIKEGSYVGYESTQSAWTYVGKATVYPKGWGTPAGIPVGGFQLDAGKTYGIMLMGIGNYAANVLFRYSAGNSVHSNNDLTLEAGVALQVPWSFDRTPSRTFDGEVFYHYVACPPSQRIALDVDFQEGVTGTAISWGAPYKGLFNKGTLSEPDGVCMGDTLTYEILPPKGKANSAYGSTWSISSVDIKTINGTTAPTAAYTYTQPASSQNAMIKLHPGSNLKDSTLLVRVVVKNLTSPAGCDSLMSRHVFISEQPTSSFIPSTTKICAGSNLSFTNNSTTGANITYKWDFGIQSTILDTSSQASPVYAYTDPGTYTVSLVTYSLGCRDSATATIFVNAAPTGGDLGKGTPYDGYFFSGQVNDPDLGCVRDTLTYELVPPTAFTAADYGTLWEVSSYSLKTTGGASTSSFTFTAPSASGNGSIVFNPGIADADKVFLLTVNYRSLNSNCKDSVLTRYISVTSSPTANFTYLGVCAGEPTAFTDASTVPQGLVVRRYDFGVNNAFATTSNPTYTYTTPGEYTVTYTVTSKGGCDDILKKKITIYADPTADFDVPAIVCAGNPATFINKASGNGATITRYKWTFTEGTSTPDTSDQANTSHVFTASGTHTAKLEVWTDGGCNGSLTKTVTVVDAPTADFPVTKGCINQPITFVNNSDGAISYEWRFSDKDTIRTKDAVKTFKFKSSYSVTLVATSASGCRDSVTRQIEFYEEPVIDFVTTSKCANQPITFTSTSTVQGGSILSWEWSFDNSPFKTGVNVSHTFTTPGTHNLKLRVKTNSGCFDSLMTTIDIEPRPTADVTLPGNACVGVAATFTNNTSGTGNSYLWDFGDGNTSTDASPVYTYANQGNYQVKMVVTNSKGCKDSVTTVLPVGLGPEVPFKWCAENKGKVVKFAAEDKSFATYEWDFGDILGGTGTGTNPTYTYLAANGEYTVTLTVTDAAGCVGTRSATVGTGDKDNSTNCIIDGINEQAKQALGMNIYPNPFSHKTLIEYELLQSQQVRVSVWDATGKEVAVLSEGMQQVGQQQITLDANEYKLPAGLYMVRIETAGSVAASQVLRLE